jgi:hypothetical protein
MAKERPQLRDDQVKSLKKINEHLQVIKDEINEHWGTDPRPDIPEVVLFIADKHKSPCRKQTEDIDPRVQDMVAITR